MASSERSAPLRPPAASRRLPTALAEDWLPLALRRRLFSSCGRRSSACFRVPLYILPPPSAIFYQLCRNLPRHRRIHAGHRRRDGLAASWSRSCSACRWRWPSPSRPCCARPSIPLAVTLEMVPKIAFAPLFVTWFGFGYLPKVIIVFLVCFFPILLNGILAFTLAADRAGPLLPLDRRRACAHFLVRAPAGRPAAALRRHQGGGGQRHRGRHHRRVDRRRRGPRLLHPDRHRRPAHGPRLRDHHRAGRCSGLRCSAP